MYRRKIVYILTALLILLVGILAYILISTYYEDKLAEREYNLYGSSLYVKQVSDEDLEDVVVELDEEVSDTVEVPEEIYKDQIKTQQGINWNAFKNKNEDFVGILSIPELDIWYPFVQNSESDYSYYLSYTYAKEKNAAGAIFLDYLFDSSFSDNHAIMFGHNMKNMTMFGSLRTLIEKQTKKEYNVYIYTEDQILIYKTYAAYLTTPDSKDYYAQLTDDLYVAYYTNAINSAMYLNNDEQVKEAFAKRNNLLTLSTCHASDHSDYTVVQNILIERIIVKDE